MAVIYVSDPIDPAHLERLHRSHTVHVGFGPDRCDYLDVADSVEAVLLRGEQFDRGMIEASPRLTIIARHGVGTNNVDLEAAQEQGIWVTVTPGGNSRAVAEHVFALALALARHVPEADRRIRHGRWGAGKQTLTGLELHSKVLGLLGFGHIGRMVAQIGRGFGMHVIAADPALDEDTAAELQVRRVELPELLEQADLLSLHLPLTSGTAGILGADELARLKPSALVVNTSRGGLIDEDALQSALQEKRLRGAALDVIHHEAVDATDPLSHTRLDVAATENLILTPHIGGQTLESLDAVAEIAITCINQALAGETPDHVIVGPALQTSS
ncbi:hydroxyacid dehydrogenase [Nesterenkonia sp. CL21]|uniref:hydroxyacid dehydrogenase n=1 Tax=Nesterenkonia sp. CL21 TaxID=3064894 RepID=UPI002878F0E5|nr:hydroxyacid dehydrogenase [Nesterenkonia sp. CL21]MDS2172436.1 hydroxyacid dehydrogenase [Nesterenkonia sp. CL21]